MSDAILSTPIVLNRVDGTSITFKRCSPADRIRLRAIFRTYRKAWFVESLSMLGIRGRDALPDLNALDGRRIRESHVIEWLNDPEGQNEAILLSLRIDNPAAEMDAVHALDLNDDERLTVGAGVMNVPVGPAREDAAGGTPLPEPPASGGTEIGAATPAASPDTAESPTP